MPPGDSVDEGRMDYNVQFYDCLEKNMGENWAEFSYEYVELLHQQLKRRLHAPPMQQSILVSRSRCISYVQRSCNRNDCQTSTLHLVNKGALKTASVSKEEKVMEEAQFYKRLCDELKDAGCPLVFGEFSKDLPVHIREQAALLDRKLNSLLSFDNPMNSSSACEQLRLFIAQGESINTFREKIKRHDFCLKCNAVWSSEAIAYRCNTCAYNPCMSLCLDCFQNANHEGHDFNRFFSQAGGACDCGNAEVLRESGFCSHHGRKAKRPPTPSANIVSLVEFIIPKLFVRLFLHFRGWNKKYLQKLEERSNTSKLTKEAFSNQIIAEVSGLIELIQTLVDYGGPLRDAVARTLLDPEIYKALCLRTSEDDLEGSEGRSDFSLDWRSLRDLETDANTLYSVQGVPQTQITFSNMLDELVFYVLRLIFPQSLINLCLSILSDIEYRNYFACRFFSLYPRIVEIMVDLTKSERNKAIYNVSARIIQSTVQILTSEAMCLKLDDDIGLMRIIVVSTEGLLGAGTQISLITQDKMTFYSSMPPSPFRGAEFEWKVYSLENNRPLRKHAYWSLVSDIQNLLGHPSIARRLLRDPITLNSYATIISRMQGMNAVFRVISGDHIEFDTPELYQLSFHLEREVAAKNMFSILYALSDEVDCMEAYLSRWKRRLQAFDWLLSICMGPNDNSTPPYVITYHIALHRHLASGIEWCLRRPAFYHLLTSMLTNDEPFLRKIALHPMRIQVCRAETAAGMWARNGNAARNMSFCYAQTTYNAAFLDCDLALLRFIATHCDPAWFLDAIAASFFLDECLKSTCLTENDLLRNRIVTRSEWCVSLIEGALRLIIELVAIRWNVGGSELESIEREVVAALAISDLTHSKLRGSIPEQDSRGSAVDDHLDELLSKVAHYDEPDQGSHIQQGVFRLTNESWWNRFEPVFCCTRAAVAKEYNDALLRVEEVEKSMGNRTMLLRLSGHLWTPYRLIDFDGNPSEDHYSKISNLFVSPICFAILRRVLNLQIVHQQLNEDILQRAVYLLTLAAKFAVSKHFDICYKPICEFNSAVLKNLHYDRKKPEGTDNRGFILSMFTYSSGSDPSILSLLLHYVSEQFTSLDSKIDAKRLVAEAILEQLQKPIDQLDRISGGAVEYIGRLFNILFHHDDDSKREIKRYIGEESEIVRQKKSDDAIAKSKAEKRLAAKRHQEAVLAAHMKKNASLMVRMMAREGLSQTQMDEMDTSIKSEVRHYDCPICGDTTTSTLEHPVGLLVHPFTHYVISQSVSNNESDLNLLDLDDKAVKDNDCLPERSTLKHWNVERRQILEKNFAYAGLVQLDSNIEVRSCGHFAHISCFEGYVETLPEARSLRINVMDSRSEVLCPVCRFSVHGLLPLAPDFDYERTRLNTSTLRGNSISQAFGQAIYDCLRGSKPVCTQNEVDLFVRYRHLFEDFMRSCRKQTLTGEESSDKLLPHGQAFTLGLARTNIERNILIAELGIVYPNDRAVSTEFLVHGARYQAKRLDLLFARLQCKQLLFDDSESEEAEGTFVAVSQEFLDTEDGLPDTDAENGGVEDANLQPDNACFGAIKNANGELFMPSIPLPLVDLKSAVLRLSAYVITHATFFPDDKIRLLFFIYKRVLLATIVRVALLLACRMPLSQMQTGIVTLTENSLLFCLNIEEFMTPFAQCVAGSFLTHPMVDVNSLLASNKDSVNWQEATLYAATDLSRFVAQLWYECGIKKPNFAIGRASFKDLYTFLSSDENLKSPFWQDLSLAKVYSWIRTSADLMKQRSILRVMCSEPVVWRPFVLLKLPTNYDDLFTRFFARRCINCDTVPRTPFICLLCSKLVCLDPCCSTPTPNNPAVSDNEVEKHAAECGNGAGCFIALNSSLTIIVAHHMATIWGSVYLDVHGEEDRNLKRGKPLFLSDRRYKKLYTDWVLQTFDQPVVSPFSFDHLPVFLHDAHLVSNF